MKTFFHIMVILLLLSSCFRHSGVIVYPTSEEIEPGKKFVEWVASTQDVLWAPQNDLTITEASGEADVEVELKNSLQTIDGFGACFNELGWTSLSLLSKKDRETVMQELFTPGVGANFTICRMPVGANDFSRNWYSCNEVNCDFEMKHFTIANDLKTLVPFIKNAQKYNPSLKLWASPWSPPAWMKYNKHYAEAMPWKGFNVENGLRPDQVGTEGSDMFIQEDKYFKAYALYFAKFIEEYRKQGINIGMVMPQNEFNSAQMFPSCTWTAKGLSRFISYLGPQMQKLNVNLFFGTLERADVRLADTVLNDPLSCKYIKGVGFQWGGKGAIAAIHQRYPDLTIYQTEQECGDGKNDWQYCVYTWSLIKHYLSNGANAFMYWNTSLNQGGISRWGWKQNSLISVDTVAKTFKYNYEYYLMKHLSHYVKPGAKRYETTGAFNNLLAFINPDKSIVIIIQNDNKEDKAVRIKVGDKIVSPSLKGDSFNTFIIKPN